MTIITGLIALFILGVIVSAPLAWFAMLFLGNIGVDWGFLTILPGAVAVNLIRNPLTWAAKK